MTVPRVVIGLLPSGGYGMRISRPGFNVLTTDGNDKSKISFNSEWPNILDIYSIGLATGIANNTVTLTYGTGYRPFMETQYISGITNFGDFIVSNVVGGTTTYNHKIIPQTVTSSQAVFGLPSGNQMLALIWAKSMD